MQKKYICLIYLFFIIIPIFSYSENEIVKKIAEELLINYDKKPYSDLTEKMYLATARKSYKRLLDLWVIYYETGKEIKFEHDFIIINTMMIIKEYSSKETGDLFILKMDKIMKLSIENFEMFKNAVLDYGLPKDINEINCDYIDRCMLNKKYFEIQKDLYTRERKLKEEIRNIMTSQELRKILTIQIFVYELIMKLRDKTIERHLRSFEEQLGSENL